MICTADMGLIITEQKVIKKCILQFQLCLPYQYILRIKIKSHKIELSIEKYTLTIFHTISEGEKDTSQAAECCLKAQICLFFKWYKQPFFANIVFLSPGLATKTEELPNMKGVNQRFKYAFQKEEKMQEVNGNPAI